MRSPETMGAGGQRGGVRARAHRGADILLLSALSGLPLLGVWAVPALVGRSPLYGLLAAALIMPLWVVAAIAAFDGGVPDR